MQRLDPDDPMRGFLRIEPESEPGSVFAYNNGATYTLGAILQERAGQSLADYLQPRLFDPLGHRPAALGHPRASPDGLLRTAPDHRGAGPVRSVLPPARQLVGVTPFCRPVGWPRRRAVHTANPGEPEPDWQRGYGYQFWRSRHGYRADGAFGQFALVLPEQDAVVVTTGETETMQPILDAVWAHLIPAFDGPVADDDDDRLAERLADLALPVEGAASYPGDDWVTSCVLTEQPDGWVLGLTDPDQRLAVGCGNRRWQRTSVPVGDGMALVVEAQGRWTDPETFVAELVFVHTPHRLTITFTPRTGSSSARWRTVPLGRVSLARLATPG